MAKREKHAFFEAGSWYHRVKTESKDGKTTYSKRGGFKTAAEAEKSYRQYEENTKKMARARNAAYARDYEIKDYLLFWLDEIYSARATNNSVALASYVIHDLLFPNMTSTVKLRHVSVEYLDAVIAESAKTCKSAGNKCRELLNIAFRDAVALGYIGKNPVPETKPYPRSKTKVLVLGKEDLKIFLKAASASPWYLEILLALFLGLRKGEIYGLKFSDFDLEQKTVRIRRQVVRQLSFEKETMKITDYQMVEKEPKTKNSCRTLRVSDKILVELEKRRAFVEECKKRDDTYEDHDYVSCMENGRPHYPSSLNAAITRICNRNGLPHITVHGLRHQFATILVENNVPLIKISALLGHSSIHTTFEYYCEVADEEDWIISFMNDGFAPGHREDKKKDERK